MNFKLGRNVRGCTQLARTETSADSVLQPNIHIVFVYVSGDNSYPKQTPAHTETDSDDYRHTRPATHARPASVAVKTVYAWYEKLISEMPHVII